MSKVLVAAVAMICLGASMQEARAGAPSTPSLSLQFNPTSVNVDPFDGTAVTASLTATIGNPVQGDMFAAQFVGAPGFSTPAPIVGVNPFGCQMMMASTYACSFPNLVFVNSSVTLGTLSFTANGALTDGLPQPITASDTFRVTVPEPGVIGLLSVGLVALGFSRRRAKRRDA